EPARQPQISSRPADSELTPEGGQHRPPPVRRQAELPRPRICLARLPRTPAAEYEQRVTERDLQIELGLPAPIAVGQRRNQPQTAPGHPHRSRTRRAPRSLPSGGEPVFDCPLGEPRFLAVVGEQCRLGRTNLREPLDEGGGDIGVELLPAAAQQGTV